MTAVVKKLEDPLILTSTHKADKQQGPAVRQGPTLGTSQWPPGDWALREQCVWVTCCAPDGSATLLVAHTSTRPLSERRRLLMGASPAARPLRLLLSSQLVDDFQELRRTLETMNLFNANLGFFVLHLAQVLILEALAWVIVWHFGSGWLVTIFISFLLTVAQGLSVKWWNNQHFQHHVKTNIYPKDPDINLNPFFVVGDLQPVKYGKNKIKFINYEKQHLYFCMGNFSGPGGRAVGVHLFTSVAFNLKSMKEMYQRRYWEDIAWVSSSYIRYFIIFVPFYGLFGTLGLMCLVNFLESPWITYVTQMSHIPMKMSKEENQDWFSTQVLATCNVEQSFFNDWFTGHLNFQIEHHLFPTMPRHNYHKVAPLVKSLCAKHGLPYVNKPMLKAFGDIARALKKSGALWKEAYCTHPQT
ncbi:fatty acid desaturase 2-like protein FADS2B [Dama dama]